MKTQQKEVIPQKVAKASKFDRKTEPEVEKAQSEGSIGLTNLYEEEKEQAPEPKQEDSPIKDIAPGPETVQAEEARPAPDMEAEKMVEPAREVRREVQIVDETAQKEHV